MSRPVYGYVYGLVLADWHDPRPPYIGKVVGRTEAAITQRVWGTSASAHTSSSSVARDPWKADILPGRKGWLRLEAVYSCGDLREDDRALRRAEADWIHRRNPVHNDVRPVRQGGERRPAPGPVAQAVAAQRRAPVRLPRRRHPKLWLFLAMAVALTFLVARVVVAMDLPWPAAPWVAAPAIGGSLAWFAFWRIHRAVRRLLR